MSPIAPRRMRAYGDNSRCCAAMRAGGNISPELVLRPFPGTNRGDEGVADMPVDDRVTVHRTFDHARIVLTGDLDIVESDALDELAVSLFSELTATVDIDMTGVTFFGSRALA